MRKIIFLLAVVTFFGFSDARSQSLRVAVQGEKGMLFNFVGLNNLGLNGYMGGIGGKYFISDGLALRAMIQFGIGDSTVKTTPEIKFSSTTFGVGGAVEYHLPLFSSVSPYLGGGLFYLTNTEKENYFTETKTTSSTFGISALAGVEYFFNQNVSLAGEYQLGLSTTSASIPDSPNVNSLRIGFQTAGLTLAVYF